MYVYLMVNFVLQTFYWAKVLSLWNYSYSQNLHIQGIENCLEFMWKANKQVNRRQWNEANCKLYYVIENTSQNTQEGKVDLC